MSDQSPHDPLEKRLWEAARSVDYPPTPEVAPQVRRRLREARPRQRGTFGRRPGDLRLAFVALLLLIVVGLLGAPQVRATILRFFRIGSVEVAILTPTPSAPSREVAPPTIAGGAAQTPAPTPTPLRSLRDLYGETRLEDAAKRMPFTIRLPTYPADLGPPDHVYAQDIGGAAVILVWLANEQVELALHQLTSDVMVHKGVQQEQLQVTSVNGRRAAWVRGEHLVQVSNGHATRQLVSGNTLIWSEPDITYRLETTLPLTEAVRVAESLR